MPQRSKIPTQVSTPAICGCHVNFNNQNSLNYNGILSFFFKGTFIRERREKYAFIDALVPVCTVNGHNSSTGRTLKSQRILRFARTISKLGNQLVRVTACFFLRNTPTVNKTVFQICAYVVKFNIVYVSRVQQPLPLLHGLC